LRGTVCAKIGSLEVDLKEDRMLRLKHRVLLSICGTLAITGAAFAQAVNEKPGEQQVPPDPATQAQQTGIGDHQTETTDQNLGPKLGEGTKAQAEHSAEATAHKSLKDPNNQLGTSLQGRTRPILGAGSPNQTAQNQAAINAAPSPDQQAPDANQPAAAE